MMILTDGFENSSREFSAAKISAMIGHQRNHYNWDFLFIGSNQDAVLSAQTIGIDANMALTQAPNPVGTQRMYGALSKKMSAHRRSGAKADLYFDADDRKEQEDAAQSK